VEDGDMDLNALLDQARESAAGGIAGEEIATQPPGAMTPGQVMQHAAGEVDQAFEQVTSRVASGFLILQEQYGRQKGNAGHERPIAFLEPGFFDGKEEALAPIAEEEGAEFDLAEALAISLDDLSAAHDLTQELFSQQRYEDAAAALFCLSLVAPDVTQLQRALGHAEYFCGRLENAVRCYYQAYACNPADPGPLFNAAFCLEAGGDPGAAADLRLKAKELEKGLAK
jgi:tetratricopeptide (TPR) repeat protein